MTQTWTLVTGGNRGIGLEVCRQILSLGKNVLLCSRNQQQGEAAAELLRKSESTSQGVCRSLPLDVSDPGSVASLVELVRTDYNQQIEALVNNAGFALKDWSKDAFETTNATNYRAPIELTQKLAPYMKPGGAVVIVSSGLGQLGGQSPEYRKLISAAASLQDVAKVPFIEEDPQGSKGVPAYCLSKALLNRAIQLLATDENLTSRGITLNAVCPGWCRTGLSPETLVNAPRSAEQGGNAVVTTLLAAQKDKLHGGFYRDGEPISW